MAPTATPATLYPHLRGDLDANPSLLEKLDKLAAQLGRTINVTSGKRTRAEQQYLYDHRASNPYPVARPGTSVHETGNAADATIDGRPIQDVVPATVLGILGLEGVKGDAVHVQLRDSKTGPGSVGPAGVINDVTGGGFDKATGAAADALEGPVNDAANFAKNKAQEAALATAKAIVGLFVDAIGADGARVLVSIALVATAVAAVGFGAARMLGVRAPLPPALALAKTATSKGSAK